jgi:hypothetical protein
MYSIPSGYLLHLLVQNHQSPLLHFMESSKLKKLMEYEARGQLVPLWLMNDILRALFEHDPDICLFHWCSSPVKEQNFRALSLWTTLLEYWIVRISRLSQDGLKEFCCMYFVTSHFHFTAASEFLVENSTNTLR